MSEKSVCLLSVAFFSLFLSCWEGKKRNFVRSYSLCLLVSAKLNLLRLLSLINRWLSRGESIRIYKWRKIYRINVLLEENFLSIPFLVPLQKLVACTLRQNSLILVIMVLLSFWWPEWKVRSLIYSLFWTIFVGIAHLVLSSPGSCFITGKVWGWGFFFCFNWLRRNLPPSEEQFQLVKYWFPI